MVCKKTISGWSQYNCRDGYKAKHYWVRKFISGYDFERKTYRSP